MFEFTPADGSLAQIIRSRRTVNDFRTEAPPLECVLQAIELARWAPNHKMTEPWHFHILGPKTASGLINVNNRILTAERGAEFARKKCEKWAKIPGWIVVTCRRSDDPVRQEEDYAAVSCAIQNLMLALWSQEIGTKWATSSFLQQPETASLLNIAPLADRVVGLIWYGYPASLSEGRRRPVTEMTTLHP